MTTANSQLVQNPRTKMYASSDVPDAGTIDLVVLTLDDLGVIRECSMACEQVFGYLPHELAGCHVSTLLPQLPDTELVQEDRINSRLAHLCHCAVAFQARRRDGQCFSSELFINRLGNHNVVALVRSLEALNRDCSLEAPSPLSHEIPSLRDIRGKGWDGGEALRGDSSISPSPQPSDGTTNHSTKPASGQVAGYPLKGEGAKSNARRRCL